MTSAIPTIPDFARLTALVSTGRHALREVFPDLSGAWQPVSSLAARLSRPEVLVRLSCQALCLMGWAEMGSLGVRRAPGVDSELLVASLAVLDYYSTFAARDFPRDLEEDGQVGDYYHLLDHVAQPTIQFLKERYAHRETLRILDYGCGLAPHTRALLGAVPGATAVLVERPEVFPLVRSEIPEVIHGRTELRSFVEWQATGGQEFDVIFVLNVLHEMSRQQQESLVPELARRLAADGELVIQVFCRDLGPPWHADALEMATAIRLGVVSNVLKLPEYVALTEEAGLTVSEKPQVQTVGGPANRLFVAAREIRP